MTKRMQTLPCRLRVLGDYPSKSIDLVAEKTTQANDFFPRDGPPGGV
jgi:hypothetical protein